MPGAVAPAYVAVDANALSTGDAAGWFGGADHARLASGSDDYAGTVAGTLRSPLYLPV
jgi:hypothetical protein